MVFGGPIIFVASVLFALQTRLTNTFDVCNIVHVRTLFVSVTIKLNILSGGNHNTSCISFAGAVFVARSKASNHCYSSESQNYFFHINLFINLLCLL